MDFEESQLQTRYTGISKAAVTDDSVTVSDHVNVTTGSDAQPTSPPPLSSPDSTSFIEGENVIAYHCSRPYAARIQRAEFNEKQWMYFIHYIILFISWDEWVGMDRLRKCTEANIRKLEECGPQTKPPGGCIHSMTSCVFNLHLQRMLSVSSTQTLSIV
ncbi:unnamed protein product [Cuscuta epithymum]|uniref:Uncharacterized protein n=1 Tax=Cuscuta epithymum TaxID=186058 RepID=A0AAV0ENW1_9ASTE|nr:unnamed protein product [Cuscuta epithymum]